MLNGLNILPVYLDYFNLDPATTGLNTAAVFIGSALAPFVSGPISDRLARRPAIFWGSVITLIGIVLQTAAQNIAMFVVGRIILGFGSILSGVAGGVYLSETFASRYESPLLVSASARVGGAVYPFGCSSNLLRPTRLRTETDLDLRKQFPCVGSWPPQ